MDEGYTDEEIKKMDAEAIARRGTPLVRTAMRLMAERDAAMYHIGDVWLRRNQAVTRAEKAEARIAAMIHDIHEWASNWPARGELLTIIHKYETAKPGPLCKVCGFDNDSHMFRLPPHDFDPGDAHG